MPRMSYQYETSPRKYEPDYTNRKKVRSTTSKKTQKASTKEKKKIQKNTETKKRAEKQNAQKAKERKIKAQQVFIVMTVFVMLLAVSYRETAIMEMFNQKKEMENQLSVIEKENGQVEKSIKEVESSLDWNKIKQVATDELGMQAKEATPLDLEKSDNVETKHEFIKEEEKSILEKIVEFFVIK